MSLPPRAATDGRRSVLSKHRSNSAVIAALWALMGFVDLTSNPASAEDSINVSFNNRGARLVGTIRLPELAGKRPGIVIVHGSGAETRETSRILQDHFVQRGYVVFAYDKRGVGESSGIFVSSICNTCPDNVDLLASDASAALTLLASRPEVDARKVGLWGASQGGWIVPHVRDFP